MEFFDKRVAKELKAQVKFRAGDKIAVGLSGGKDSVVLLHQMSKITGPMKEVELIAIGVDEGIEVYRPASLETARSNCEELGVQFHVSSYKETLNISMDEVQSRPQEKGACSYCGVWRRNVLNISGNREKIDYLAIGHNLDDTAQSILMNFVRGDMARMARLGPHSNLQSGLIPRLLPMRRIPEKEVYLYASVQGYEFYDEECPYAGEAMRGEFQDIVYQLENSHPGTRHALINSFEEIRAPLRASFPPMDLVACSQCGEPTSDKLCRSCILLNDVRAS